MRQKIVLYSAIFVLAVSIVNLFVGNGKVYQLDLFSVISFGLAIAAFLLSMFAAWISWEFYKKSTDALDSVQSSVNKIETSVTGVQNNITEIVQTAVKHWTQSAGASNPQLADDLYESLKGELDSVKTSGPELEARVNNVLAKMARDIASAQARAIFPSGDFNPPATHSAINVSQETTCDEPDKLEGVIRFDLGRTTRNATYRLRAKNISDAIKYLNLTMESLPDDVDPKSIKLRHGTDQNGSLNIHMAGSPLIPAGEYVVKFEAVYG